MKRSDRYLHMRIEPDLKNRFTAVCDQHNVTLSQAVRWLLLTIINGNLTLEQAAKLADKTPAVTHSKPQTQPDGDFLL